MAKQRRMQSRPAPSRELPKCPSGIRGLDEITDGGLPRGRPTLVCGSAGTGKTLFGMEFLVRGALDHGEPGVFVSFEERPADLTKNTASLGFDLEGLVRRKKLFVEQIAIDRSEILETGEYNLDGLFIRLGAAIDSVRAKRVVLDTIEVLFAALANLGILRSELRRLFEWLKDRNVTTVVTGERGEGMFTRHGLEEYVSDCVIVLDQRMMDQIATRRLRIVKYRGSIHGTNEYPFLIDEQGFLILPITTIKLDYAAPRELVSSGVGGIDAMLGGKGVFRGSTVMVSGGAGTGKTSIAAHFADAACRRGERCMYFAFEESPAQIERNMSSVGLDLERWSRRGLLRFSATRPTTFGLEVHISMMLKQIDEFRPHIVVVDPVSSLGSAGPMTDVSNMLMRAVDQLKSRKITTMFTSLTSAAAPPDQTSAGVSSLIDTWILLRNIEQNGERTRGLEVLKSRGVKHSNQIRELLLTDHGLRLQDIYVGPDGILTGSARMAQQMRDQAAAAASRREMEYRNTQLASKRRALDAQIAKLESEFSEEEHAIERSIRQENARQELIVSDRATLAAERAGQKRRTKRYRAANGTIG